MYKHTVLLNAIFIICLLYTTTVYTNEIYDQDNKFLLEIVWSIESPAKVLFVTYLAQPMMKDVTSSLTVIEPCKGIIISQITGAMVRDHNISVIDKYSSTSSFAPLLDLYRIPVGFLKTGSSDNFIETGKLTSRFTTNLECRNTGLPIRVYLGVMPVSQRFLVSEISVSDAGVESIKGSIVLYQPDSNLDSLGVKISEVQWPQPLDPTNLVIPIISTDKPGNEYGVLLDTYRDKHITSLYTLPSLVSKGTWDNLGRIVSCTIQACDLKVLVYFVTWNDGKYCSYVLKTDKNLNNSSVESVKLPGELTADPLELFKTKYGVIEVLKKEPYFIYHIDNTNKSIKYQLKNIPLRAAISYDGNNLAILDSDYELTIYKTLEGKPIINSRIKLNLENSTGICTN